MLLFVRSATDVISVTYGSVVLLFWIINYIAWNYKKSIFHGRNQMLSVLKIVFNQFHEFTIGKLQECKQNLNNVSSVTFVSLVLQVECNTT